MMRAINVVGKEMSVDGLEKGQMSSPQGWNSIKQQIS